MKAVVADPWSSSHQQDSQDSRCNGNSGVEDNNENSFEDSFVNSQQRNEEELPRLPDSEEYLARLNSRLKSIQGGTSKRDLINSLSVAKEDCIARLITARQNLESTEEQELAANPLIRHIAPHLQALSTNELVHLLKADELQKTVDELDKETQERVNPEQQLDTHSDTQEQKSKE